MAPKLKSSMISLIAREENLHSRRTWGRPGMPERGRLGRPGQGMPGRCWQQQRRPKERKRRPERKVFIGILLDSITSALYLHVVVC